MAAVSGISGSVVSWTNNTGLVTGGVAPASFTLEMEGQEFDSTAFSASGISTFTKGLAGYTGTIINQLKTRTMGENGSVTFSSGYVLNANSWTLDIEVEELETTAFSASVRSFIPGRLRWSGSFSGYVDGGTTDLSDVPTGPGSATFLFQADNNLSGSIFTTGCTVNVNPSEVQTYTYRFRGTGDLTQSGAAEPMFTASQALAIPTAGNLDLKSTANQTFRLASAFWTRVSITAAVNQLTVVNVSFRSGGALTQV